MPKNDPVNCDRRAVLAVGGALILRATLWPAITRAQTNLGSKMPIGTIGAGHIGSTIGGLWVKDGHKVFFSSAIPTSSTAWRQASGRWRRPAPSTRQSHSATQC